MRFQKLAELIHGFGSDLARGISKLVDESLQERLFLLGILHEQGQEDGHRLRSGLRDRILGHLVQGAEELMVSRFQLVFEEPQDDDFISVIR